MKTIELWKAGGNAIGARVFMHPPVSPTKRLTNGSQKSKLKGRPGCFKSEQIAIQMTSMVAALIWKGARSACKKHLIMH